MPVTCFGDRVLDLQPRVRLDEVERRVVAGDVRVDEELERADVVVAQVAREPHRRIDDAIAQRWREAGRGRDLDQLLVAALQRAVALPQVRDGAGAVADDLHFDVAGARQQLLDVDIAVAERAARLGLAARVGLVEIIAGEHDAHAAPAAAGDRLDDNGGRLA